MTGVEMIEAERKRQIEIEWYFDEDDDRHDGSELALAAICYAAAATGQEIRQVERDRINGDMEINDPWPLTRGQDKRKRHLRRKNGHIRCLVIAGALIAAEIDRLQRRRV